MKDTIMPTPPKNGEDRKTFIGRCVSFLISEGKSKDQSVAICYSMWKEHSKKKIEAWLKEILNEQKD